ncbi:hypothetical protein BGP_5349 [Beggiatoa sp. PS]|nr:hypothetical protein BGP_5349 [Beggiatoa sp. PS]
MVMQKSLVLLPYHALYIDNITFFSNVACSNVNKTPKEILQKESIFVHLPTSEKPKIPQKKTSTTKYSNQAYFFT